jgi:LPS biosynthesis protein
LTKTFLKNDPNFKDCIEVLNKLKVNYWLCHGTLLGLIRDKSLIPWDNDIDIGSWDLKNKEQIIQAFVKKGFTYRNKFLEAIYSR